MNAIVGYLGLLFAECAAFGNKKVARIKILYILYIQAHVIVIKALYQTMQSEN